MAGRNLATAGDEVQRGGLGEQAERVADQIWGDGEEGLTRAACQRWRGSAMGEEGRQAGVGVTGGVRTVEEEVLGGAKHGVGKRGMLRSVVSASYSHKRHGSRQLGSGNYGRKQQWWWLRSGIGAD
jgi:hypothetical protein